MKIDHHAVLVRCEVVRDRSSLVTEGEIQDVYFQRFGIDDARELVRLASQRPAEDAVRTFVVRAEFITHEAQNALLKILEEPPLSTKFVFVLPPDFTVLATLSSRFVELSEEGEVESEGGVFADFLSATYKDRIAAIEVSAKKKDADWQRAIKRGLIAHLRLSQYDADMLEQLEYVTRMLLTRGASNKMLLEHAALTLPTR